MREQQVKKSFLANGININSEDIATLDPDTLMNDNIVTVLLM
jgi:Ulp1 family protease